MRTLSQTMVEGNDLMKRFRYTPAHEPEDLGFTAGELAGRVLRAQSLMAERDISLMVVTDQADIQYLTGARDMLGTLPMVLLLPVEGDYTVVTRAVDAQAFKPQSVGALVIEYLDHESPMDAICRGVRSYDVARGERLGVTLRGTELSASMVDELRAELVDFVWTDSSDIVWQLCAVKSETELAHMREAARINGEALAAAISSMRPGVPDQDVAAALVESMLRSGSHMTPGYYQVVSGLRTLTAHATHNGSLLAHDDHVLFEFTACRFRYNAPLMRTAVVGTVPSAMQRLHDAAVTALEAAIAAMSAGARSADVDAAAARELERHGVRQLRPHRTGYLVGASPAATRGGWPQGHIMNLRADDPSVLVENMTFHLPMALYDPEFGAVGVSETVRVTASGGEALGSTPRELLRAT